MRASSTKNIAFFLVYSFLQPHTASALDQAKKEQLFRQYICNSKSSNGNASELKGFRETTSSYIKRKLNPEFEFYIVGCNTNFPQEYYQVAAISQAGELFKMPDELPKVLSKLNLKINTTQDALELVETYLSTSSSDEKIITKPSDIPGYYDNTGSPRHTVLSKKQENLLKKPTITNAGDTFRVTLYSWIRIGGFLLQDTLTVSKTGEIHSESSSIADRVGKYFLPR